MKKVLVIQTAFLGDVILSTPLAENLKSISSDTQVHYLVKKGNEGLLKNHPFIDQVHTFDKSNSKSKSLKEIIQKVRSFRFDEVYNLHRFGSSGIITIFSGAKTKVGFKKNPWSFLFSKRVEHCFKVGWHEVDRNNKLLQEVYPDANLVRRPILKPSDRNLQKVENHLKTAYVCFAPASVWTTKAMPEELWVKLGRRLSSEVSIYIIGGSGDEELCDRIAKQIGSECESLAGKLSLMDSVALLQGANRAYVNDSGPMHMASSVNCPTTAFYCSTSPQFGFGPLADDAQVIEINESLACRPCGLHGHVECPEKHFRCGHELPIELAK